MEEKKYILDRIEGDYAYLKETETGEEIFIAMALLPDGAEEGCRLRCELFSYTLDE